MSCFNGKGLCGVLGCLLLVGMIFALVKRVMNNQSLVVGHGIPVECGAAPMDQVTDFIVAFNPGYTPQQVAQVCTHLPAGANPSISDQRCIIKTTCQKIQNFIMKHNPKEGHKGVVFIEADSMFTMRAPKPTNVNPSNYNWNLQRITERTPSYSDQYNFPAQRGKGVHIYILDTGVRTTHVEFGGRAIPTLETVNGQLIECLPTDTSCAADNNGHGTHVAGIAAGENCGVAKDATIHAVKVANQDGQYYSSWAAKAVDWVRHHGLRPAIISMSLDAQSVPFASYTIDLAVHDAVRDGITVVVAAGNSASTETPGYDACKYTPAKEPYAITVASTDEQDQRDLWSNYGKCVDIFAPGNNINSAWYTSDTAMMVQSGTSEATPLAAGVAAVGLSQGVQQPTISSWLLEQATKGVVTNLKGGPNLLLYLSP